MDFDVFLEDCGKQVFSHDKIAQQTCIKKLQILCWWDLSIDFMPLTDGFSALKFHDPFFWRLNPIQYPTILKEYFESRFNHVVEILLLLVEWPHDIQWNDVHNSQVHLEDVSNDCLCCSHSQQDRERNRCDRDDRGADKTVLDPTHPAGDLLSLVIFTVSWWEKRDRTASHDLVELRKLYNEKVPSIPNSWDIACNFQPLTFK